MCKGLFAICDTGSGSGTTYRYKQSNGYQRRNGKVPWANWFRTVPGRGQYGFWVLCYYYMIMMKMGSKNWRTPMLFPLHNFRSELLPIHSHGKSLPYYSRLRRCDDALFRNNMIFRTSSTRHITKMNETVDEKVNYVWTYERDFMRNFLYAKFVLLLYDEPPYNKVKDT